MSKEDFVNFIKMDDSKIENYTPKEIQIAHYNEYKESERNTKKFQDKMFDEFKIIRKELVGEFKDVRKVHLTKKFFYISIGAIMAVTFGWLGWITNILVKVLNG